MVRAAIRSPVKPLILAALSVFFLQPTCRAELITGTNFDARNWNLIANFREGAGLVTKDSSTNTITLDLTNGPTWVSNKNGRGKAINFDGSDDIVTVPLALEGLFDFTDRSTFTVVVLFRNPSGGDDRVLVSKVTWPTAGWVFRTGASGAKLGLYLRGSGGTNQYLEAIGISNAMFINNNWHTAAFVYRGKLHGTTLKELWFDGVQYALTSSGTTGTTGDLLNDALLTIGNTDALTFSNMINDIGCVMVSREGYAPSPSGMMSLHRRLMGQVARPPR